MTAADSTLFSWLLLLLNQKYAPLRIKRTNKNKAMRERFILQR